MEKTQHSNWVELFENHCCAYDVLDHIDPKTPRPKEVSDRLWKRLDAVVKQWIYGTISPSLVQIILSRGSTAQETWNKVQSLFQNNKHSRAVLLDNKFATVHLSHFPNATAYCQEIKNIADQLANIDQPISEQKMVLHLCAGLRNTEYDTVATLIQQCYPLPDFLTPRSKLLIEESRRAEEPHPSPQSFVAAPVDPAAAGSSLTSTQQSQPHQQVNTSGGWRGGGRGGRGRGGGRGGRGYRGGRGSRGGSSMGSSGFIEPTDFLRKKRKKKKN
ncbi:Retrovirus-related Pol polyprotein from transposon TNT 1-94 [Bienertia sinuspersici]